MFIKVLGIIYFALIIVSLFSTVIATINVFRDPKSDVFEGFTLFEKIMNIVLVIIMIPFIPIIATIDYCKKIM